MIYTGVFTRKITDLQDQVAGLKQTVKVFECVLFHVGKRLLT
jgi:hypothetical protein